VGLFDKIKDLAGDHADKVGDAIEKVAQIVDDKTGGKYADQIEKGVDAAKGFVGDDAEKGGAPPASAPPTPAP
jgi:hypothetical protein